MHTTGFYLGRIQNEQLQGYDAGKHGFMIIVGIGANLAHPAYGMPRRTCGAALATLAEGPLQIAARSSWYASAPVTRDGSAPSEEQPWYINGAIAIDCELDATMVLEELLGIERAFGRERSQPDAPRTLDLDILAFNDAVIDNTNLTIPHPRLYQRAFALLPIADIAPDWRHPVTGKLIGDLINELDEEQGIQPQPDAPGFMGTEWAADASNQARFRRMKGLP